MLFQRVCRTVKMVSLNVDAGIILIPQRRLFANNQIFITQKPHADWLFSNFPQSPCSWQLTENSLSKLRPKAGSCRFHSFHKTDVPKCKFQILVNRYEWRFVCLCRETWRPLFTFQTDFFSMFYSVLALAAPFSVITTRTSKVAWPSIT